MAQPKNVHCMAVHACGPCAAQVLSLMTTYGWTGYVYEPVGYQARSTTLPGSHRHQRLDPGKDVVASIRSLHRAGAPAAVAGEFTLEQVSQIQAAGARVLAVRSRGPRNPLQRALGDAADYVLDEDETSVMYRQLHDLFVSMAEREELRRRTRKMLGAKGARKLVQNTSPSRVWLRLMAAVKERHARREDYAGLFALVEQIRSEVAWSL